MSHSSKGISFIEGHTGHRRTLIRGGGRPRPAGTPPQAPPRGARHPRSAVPAWGLAGAWERRGGRRGQLTRRPGGARRASPERAGLPTPRGAAAFDPQTPRPLRSAAAWGPDAPFLSLLRDLDVLQQVCPFSRREGERGEGRGEGRSGGGGGREEWREEGKKVCPRFNHLSHFKWLVQ